MFISTESVEMNCDCKATDINTDV